MQYYTAPVRALPMLKQVHALPGAERELSITDRNGDLSLGKSRANVRGHIVWTFGGMAIEARVLGDYPAEKFGQVSHNVGVGIFLNDERCRRMLAENGHEAGLGRMALKPRADLACKFVQAFAAGRNVNLVGELLHSTVTLLARLRG
jgi:hypothetical protein